MKTYLFLMLAALFSNHISSQSQVQPAIPDKIIKAVRERCPSTITNKWTIKNNIYSVHFVAADNKKGTATFDTNEMWKSSETVVSSTRQLPPVVKNSFNKGEFGAWYIERISKRETHGDVTYTSLINNGNTLDGDHHDAFFEKYLLVFSVTGTMESKTMLK